MINRLLRSALVAGLVVGQELAGVLHELDLHLVQLGRLVLGPLLLVVE